MGSENGVTAHSALSQINWSHAPSSLRRIKATRRIVRLMAADREVAMDDDRMALPFDDERKVAGAEVAGVIAGLLGTGDVAMLQVTSGKGDLVLNLPLSAQGIAPRWTCVLPYLERLAEATIRTRRRPEAVSARAASALQDVD